MSAAWIHMMYQVCSNYDDLNSAMRRGPTFIAEITIERKKYTLTIEEIWHNDITGSYISIPASSIENDIISWVEKNLEKRTYCKRTSRNTWEFSSQHAAEKFQTLFYLSWDQSSIR